MTALQLRSASVSVEVGGEENRRGSSSFFHALAGSKLKSFSSSVSFRRRPPYGRRRAQASVLTMALAAQAPAHPACPDPLSQGHHHAIIPEDDKKNKPKWEEKEPVSPEKLDQWIRDSIGEIVRNIEEAPFLVQIFSRGGGGGSGGAGREGGVILEREAASPESWPCMRKRWNKGSPKPEGFILVEKLAIEEEMGAASVSTPCGPRTWGLLVQGRGMDCALCYILNTTRVRSSMGFCTYFCLMKAKCFGEPAELQFRRAWLRSSR
ncbi:uncharacterized protein [Elaeis guineensis]|uniref:Uncharacterized protein LOC105035775 n=1 Tax=Elaeis guineensis var. tenera TaxID=51953 RepID=A0A6I9QKD3_ELAGV|nr:uncharacterized protein LOC105035775 [Elaeis guineensis]